MQQEREKYVAAEAENSNSHIRKGDAIYPRYSLIIMDLLALVAGNSRAAPIEHRH